MKKHITRKQLQAINKPIISISYCKAQFLLQFQEPNYYNASRSTGWNFDAYDLGNCIICTGYRPVRNEFNYKFDLLKAYENLAQKYNNEILEYENKKACINSLLYKFVDTVLGNL